MMKPFIYIICCTIKLHWLVHRNDGVDLFYRSYIILSILSKDMGGTKGKAYMSKKVLAL